MLAPASAIEVEIEDAKGSLELEVVDDARTCAILRPIDVTATGARSTIPALNPLAVPELQVFNGGMDGLSPANEGEVTVGGVQVLSRTELREKVSAFLSPVTLPKSSVLTARAGKKGSFTLQIVDRDETPPRLTLAAFTDGSFTNQPHLNLAGAVDDPSATVTVNGAPASTSGGTYTGTVSLSECWNVVTVTARDACGNSAETSVRIGLDTTAPVVGILSPANGLLSNAASQHILVRYSDGFSGVDPSSVHVTLDGAEVTGRLQIRGDAAEGDLVIGEGAHAIVIDVRDRAGNVASAQAAFAVDGTPPIVSVVAPVDGSVGNHSPISFTTTWSDALSGVLLPSLSILLDGKEVTNAFAAGPISASASIPLAAGSHQLQVTIADVAGNVGRAVSRFDVAPGGGLPPDPASVAPPVDTTIPYDIASTTAFLYTEPDPIQGGVQAGAIEPRRVAVLRGVVASRDGGRIGGVRITVLGHPEFGSTLTRADGMFDMAVNGGGQVTLSYQKDGFLHAERNVQAPWRDFAWASPVVLVPFDTAVTEVRAGAATVQVARGNEVTDHDGTRRATVLFPAGTSAKMLMPDGSTTDLGTIHVRATEFTVGVTGRAAMPAELPASSAYTYAVDLSVDEAVMAGAKQVNFSQPVNVYLENFLSIPVGIRVPSGYYDPERAAWVPSDDGRVIRVLSTAGGVASIDSDGDGVAEGSAALATLGFSEDEARRLATLYSAGQTLWRVRVGHFTSWDFNFAVVCPIDTDGAACAPPNAAPPSIGSGPDRPDSPSTCGSIIDCGNQSLGEQVEIPGAGVTLSYSSLHQLGRKAERRIAVPLPRRTSSTALGLAYEVRVAGRLLTQRASSTSQDVVTFLWDGRDAYGRPVEGSTPVVVKLGAVYRSFYARMRVADGRSFAVAPSSFDAAPGRYEECGANCPMPDGALRSGEIVSWQTSNGSLYSSTALPQRMGGWTFNELHAYDPVAKVVRRGDGTVQATGVIGAHVIATFASGGFATGMAAAPDGSVFTAEGELVWRIDPDGKRNLYAGGGLIFQQQSGVPATRVALVGVTDLSYGPDGSVYLAGVSTQFFSAVRRIRPDGIIEDFAGTHGATNSTPVGDEGPAISAGIVRAAGVAAAPDGSVYILADNRIRKVTPDGVIHRFAGDGSTCCASGTCSTCCNGGDGGPATIAQICGAHGVTVGPDGSVYFADGVHHVVRRVLPDGVIERFAGVATPGFAGDGGYALGAKLNAPAGVATALDGSIYISEIGNKRVRRVGRDGVIETVAGMGDVPMPPPYLGDGGPATAATLSFPSKVSIWASGELVIADAGNGRIRRVGAPFPGFSLSEFVVASKDGGELYVFGSSGSHLRTIDARTGVVIRAFGRDEAGRVISVTDRNGLVTRIERNGDVPTAIVSPYGQRTALVVDGNGYISQVVDPVGGSRRFVYDADGLMRTYSDPRGNLHTFTYDETGRLLKDENAVGGHKTLARTERPDGTSVSVTTALGRATVHEFHALTTGDEVRTTTQPDGTATVRKDFTSGTQSVTRSDGTATLTRYGPDPQWRMQSPLVSEEHVTTPSGLALVATTSSSVTLANPADLLSLSTRTDSRTVNGRTATSTWDAATRTRTVVTPAGRRSISVLDGKGHLTKLAVPGVLPTTFQYDAQGRLTSTVQGLRTTSITYDADGNPKTVTDPTSRTTTFTYDRAGRVLAQAMPGGRTVSFDYDASGNLKSLVPPGRPSHEFRYTGSDQTSVYIPPAAADVGLTSTTYDYDLDGMLAQTLLPDSTTIAPAYDYAGRLSSITTARGTTAMGYDTAGRIASVTAPDGGGLTYGFDGALPTSETSSGAFSGTVAWTYDNDFRVASTSVNGASVSYRYDADGLITRAGALTISREAESGRVGSTTLGAVTTGLRYNDYGDLEHLDASASGSNVFSCSFERDLSGRITGKTETVQGVTETYVYGYDDAGRLATVSKNGRKTSSYLYDDNGNRLSKITDRGTEGGSYDEQDRMIGYGGASYAYRPNGELASKTVAGQTTLYDYDALGNLRAAVLPDGRQIEYVIDGRNRRVGKKVNGALVEGFLYDGQLRPVAWLDGSGQIYARFVYGLHANVPGYMVVGSTPYRIITDHLGSPRLIVNASTGAVVQRIAYDEWGQVVNDTNPGFQPFGFAGGLYDRDTGLVRFGARDYEPSVGRWTNKDPIRFAGGLNLFVYCDNDPINRMDPSGKLFFLAPQLAGAATGAVVALAQGLVSGQSGWDLAMTVATGAGEGFLLAYLPISGLLSGAFWGGSGGALTSVANQFLYKSNAPGPCGGGGISDFLAAQWDGISADKVIDDAVAGAGGGLAAGLPRAFGAGPSPTQLLGWDVGSGLAAGVAGISN